MAYPQRLVVGMLDGFGVDYFESGPMPVLKAMAREGLYRQVECVIPSVTNANNTSICCGAWPEAHGLTGNVWFDETTGREDYMESADFLRVPTLLQRAAAQGVRSALLTCKKKTVRLLGRGAAIAVAAEEPPPEFVQRYGRAPEIYSREINYWLWKVAGDLLKREPDLGVLYVHITDYPMHAWAPDRAESREHLATLDGLFGEARAAAPDAAFGFTADHGMNYKTVCRDLKQVCAARGFDLRYALSVEKDRYVRHHRTFGGIAWVYLHSPDERDRAAGVLRSIPGVERVLPREEAAARYRLMPERIGQLVVLGDRDTVFGDLPAGQEEERLEPTYRSHGSEHERAVPLVLWNCEAKLPPAAEFRNNHDLVKWAYR
mgnify:CR=1 FL=1